MGADRTQTEPDRAQTRRARVAVAALFLTNGAVFANILPRYPEIKSDLGLSNSAYGAAVAAFSVGALAAGLTAAALIRRYRSSRVAVVGTIGIGVFVLVAGVATSPAMLAGALFVAGACDSVTDVAQNAHGLRVQRIYRRSIINSLHAVWAAGAILGGLMGGAAIALGISRAVHLGVAGALCSAVVLVAYRHLLPGADDDGHPAAQESGRGRAGVAVYATLLALVVLAVAGATVEDAGNTWAILYLRDSLDAPRPSRSRVTSPSSGPSSWAGWWANRLVDRFGERAVVRAGGAVTALGMGLALAFPSVPGTIAGFALAGLGVAVVIPSAMHAADQLPGLRPGSGLTILTWLMRIGFFGAPLLVGVIADAAGLRAGLLAVPAVGVVIVVLAGALSARHRRVRS